MDAHSMPSRSPIAIITLTIVTALLFATALLLATAWVRPVHAQSDHLVVPASNPSVPLPTSTSVANAILPISALTADRVGQIVQVHARIIDVTYPNHVLEFVLDDGTGKIRLQAESKYDYKSAQQLDGLNYGADVLVTAQLGIDRGVLHLATLPGKPITVLAPGSTRNVANIPLEQLGKVGVVTAYDGVISDVQPYADGTLVIVANKDGALRVKLSNRLLQYVRNAARLVTGAYVRAVGRIEYARDLMLVPVMSSDITIR